MSSHYGLLKWEILRVRTDKSTPNTLQTATSVMKSIVDAVTDAELLDFIKANCLPKLAMFRKYVQQQQQQQH